MFRNSLLLCALIIPSLNPGDPVFTRVADIPCRADDISSDAAGNVYILERDAIRKYDQLGKPLSTYGNKVSGEITSMDVSGTLTVMAFYMNPGKVLFLDNNLAPIRDPVKLQELGFADARLASLSSEKGFWVYDAQKDAITRLSVTNQSVLTETGLLSQAIGEKVEPVRMLESGNRLFILTKKGEVFAFDHFGAYLGKMDVSGVSAFQVNEDRLFCLDSAGMRLDWLKLKTLEKGSIVLPEDSVVNFRYDTKKIYLQFPEKLTIYSLSEG